MGRPFAVQPEGSGSFLLLLQLGKQFAVLALQLGHTPLKVGDHLVEGVGESFAVRDALFQRVPRDVGFRAHGPTITQGARLRKRPAQGEFPWRTCPENLLDRRNRANINCAFSE